MKKTNPKIIKTNTDLDQQELVVLLRESLSKNQELVASLGKIKSYMFWEQFWGVLRFLIIAIPLILGFIYLPPLVRESSLYQVLMQYYQSLPK